MGGNNRLGEGLLARTGPTRSAASRGRSPGLRSPTSFVSSVHDLSSVATHGRTPLRAARHGGLLLRLPRGGNAVVAQVVGLAYIAGLISRSAGSTAGTRIPPRPRSVARGQRSGMTPDSAMPLAPGRTCEAMSSGAAAESELGSPCMDMLKGEQIAEADLTDWRKLAQGLHARYVVDDFGAGARFVAAVGGAGDALGHHPRVRSAMGTSTSSWSPTTPSTATARAPNTSSNG